MRKGLRFKVTLNYMNPPIWREFQTPGDITFGKLHIILQVVMGWQNAHLHQFTVGQTHFSDPITAVEFGDESEQTSLVADYVKQGDTIRYTYDFGDSWEHTITLTQIMSEAESLPYPLCLDGDRACPPEDCGGPPGYDHLLHTLQHPGSQEYDDLLEWYGDDLDPEAFDRADINAVLRNFI